MIRIKKSGQRPIDLGALAPIFELLAFAEGQYVPRKPYKSVRVYTRKGVAKPRLDRII